MEVQKAVRKKPPRNIHGSPGVGNADFMEPLRIMNFGCSKCAPNSRRTSLPSMLSRIATPNWPGLGTETTWQNNLPKRIAKRVAFEPRMNDFVARIRYW